MIIMTTHQYRVPTLYGTRFVIIIETVSNIDSRLLIILPRSYDFHTRLNVRNQYQLDYIDSLRDRYTATPLFNGPRLSTGTRAFSISTTFVYFIFPPPTNTQRFQIV